MKKVNLHPNEKNSNCTECGHNIPSDGNLWHVSLQLQKKQNRKKMAFQDCYYYLCDSCFKDRYNYILVE